MPLGIHVKISTLRQLAGEATGFNIFVETWNQPCEEGDPVEPVQLLVNGLRVAKGRIYPPAYKNKNGTYTQSILFSKNVAEILYKELTKVLTYDILPIDQAIKPLLWSQDIINKFILE